MKFEIKSRFTSAVIFTLETESLRFCVEAAVKSGANLYGATLYGANLGGATLYGANLRGANLYGADLGGANQCGENLYGEDQGGATLYGANLRGANLRGADLGGANLYGANLYGADLRGARLSKDGAELLLIGSRPVLQIGPIGSRADYLIAFTTDHGVYVRAGCFFDTLAKFTAAVKETHGTNEHALEYKAAIAMIKTHAKLWSKS